VTNACLLIDGTTVASFSGAPFVYQWNTTHATDGVHVLRAKAADVAGNVGRSSPLSVRVDNRDIAPPTVYISYPASGTNVTRDDVVTIEAKASDDVEVARVDFYVNSALVCSIKSAPYVCAWRVPESKAENQ
jgi:chitinase